MNDYSHYYCKILFVFKAVKAMMPTEKIQPLMLWPFCFSVGIYAVMGNNIEFVFPVGLWLTASEEHCIKIYYKYE